MKQENTIFPKEFFTIGALGALAVALGALGAHYLKSKVESGLVSNEQLNGFDTAVKYHMYHILAMTAIVILKENFKSKYLNLAYRFFLWGIALFSGSLYLLCTRNLFGASWLYVLGPVTPLGGLALIVGWLCLFLAAAEKKH